MTKEVPECIVIVDHKIGFAIPLLALDDLVGQSFLVSPRGIELAIAHVRFFEILTGLQAAQLEHESVADVSVVLGFAHFEAWHDAKFNELGVHDIVQGDQVGPGFLEGGSVLLEGFFGGADAGVELAGCVADDLVEVGMQIAGEWAKFLGTIDFCLVPSKFLNGTAFGSHFVVGVDNVTESHRFGAVHFSDPIRVGEVDANGSGGRGITGLLDDGNHFGGYAGHLGFLVFCKNGGLVFKPLGLVANRLNSFGRFHVAERYNGFVRGPHSQWVAVNFNKTVHHIDHGFGVLNPSNVIRVPGFEVACFVVFFQKLQGFLLLGILSDGDGFLKPKADAVDGLTVQTS